MENFDISSIDMMFESELQSFLPDSSHSEIIRSTFDSDSPREIRLLKSSIFAKKYFLPYFFHNLSLT